MADARRPYRSPLREDSARRTRDSVRDAAARLFVRQGYVSTTVKEIAVEAGVAQRTVFTAFPGGKADIFRAALDTATRSRAAGSVRVAPTDSDRDPTADEIVERIVDFTVAILERGGPLLVVAAESAGADPEMRAIVDRDAEATAANARALAAGLRGAGFLRADLSVDRAADVLCALGAAQVHATLRFARGWSVDDYRTWLVDQLRFALLGPDGARAPTPSR